MEQGDAGHVAWSRRLSRCAMGVTLAVVSGWLIIILLLTGWGMVRLMTDTLNPNTSPFVAAMAFGFFGAITAAPLALFIGAPMWLIADQRGLNRASSGAIAGALIGVLIAFFIPFLIMVLPFVGAGAGYLSLSLTNRFLPKH